MVLSGLAMQYKITKTENGTRLEIGNLVTFMTDLERQEIIAVLMQQEDTDLFIERLASHLKTFEKKDEGLAIAISVYQYLISVGWWQFTDTADTYKLLNMLRMSNTKGYEK